MSLSVGIFGGSFDPVHNGHVKSADFICSKIPLDKMIVIPTALSPFKDSSAASDEDRLSMCRLAFPDPVYEVSDTEVTRGGKSYSVDTVNDICAAYPGADFYMLVGSDQLLSFARWYRYEDILRKVTLCAVSREEDPLKQRMEEYAGKYLRPYGRCLIFSFEPFIISSSEIRQKIEAGGDISAYVPGAVASFIAEKGLYK